MAGKSRKSDTWSGYLKKEIVVDTNSPFVYLGRLVEVTDNFIILEDVDVHDKNETPSTKERYILDAKKFGINVNRKRVSVKKEMIISISKLEDIVEY